MGIKVPKLVFCSFLIQTRVISPQNTEKNCREHNQQNSKESSDEQRKLVNVGLLADAMDQVDDTAKSKHVVSLQNDQKWFVPEKRASHFLKELRFARKHCA